MKCPNCHSEIPNQSKFCRVCGNSIPQPTTPLTSFNSSALSSTDKLPDRTLVLGQGVLLLVNALAWILPIFKIYLGWDNYSYYSLIQIIFSNSYMGIVRLLIAGAFIFLVFNIFVAIRFILQPKSNLLDFAAFETHNLAYGFLFLFFFLCEKAQVNVFYHAYLPHLTIWGWMGLFACLIDIVFSVWKLWKLGTRS